MTLPIPPPPVSAEEDYYEDDEEDDPDALTDPLYQLDLQVRCPVSEGLPVPVLAPVPVLPPQCPCSHPGARAPHPSVCAPRSTPPTPSPGACAPDTGAPSSPRLRISGVTKITSLLRENWVLVW